MTNAEEVSAHQILCRCGYRQQNCWNYNQKGKASTTQDCRHVFMKSGMNKSSNISQGALKFPIYINVKV